MKQAKQFLFLLALLVLFSEFKVNAQSQEFPLAAYLYSSKRSETTYYQNYWQMKQLGLNTVIQRSIVEVPSIDQESNFDSLMQFNTIIALNDSTTDAYNENNIDWIYYFTNALYTKWEAEGSPYFSENEPVGVKHNSVGYPTSDGYGWSSGGSISDIGKFFILGPNYQQYMKYVYTNKFEGENPLISYKTNFSMKLAQDQTDSFPVARLIVSVKNDSDGTETTLIDSTIYSNQLTTTAYTSIICKPYDYLRFQSVNNEGSNYNGAPPGPAWYAPQGIASTDFLNENLKIQFKVQKLAQAEVIVDYIEVYDAGLNSIWDGWFVTRLQEVIDNIFYYNQKFSSLGSKFKYYHTMDEPNSIDCFEPIRRVQSILDSLNTGRDLITHFCTGWDNKRDGVNALEKWLKIAKPKKLNHF
ncbi:MAG: hypothetical protein WAT79_00030 [Saprospiraceae bacterium]